MSSPNALREHWILLVLLFLGLLIYLPGLSGGYILDDFGNLVENTAFAPVTLHAHFWAAIWSSGSGPTDRPLSMLTFALQDWFTGLAPWPLKLVNVLIHAANGFLVFRLTRAVLGFIWRDRHGIATTSSISPWLIGPSTLALLITAAWLLTPIQLTAVLYVIQRMESLSALFVLGGLLLYWQGRMRLLNGQAGGWWRILAGLLGGTTLAVLAKETGVMLPVYAFLLEWLVLRGRVSAGFEPKFVVLYALVLFLPGIAGVLYTLPSALNGTAYASRPFDLAQRLWTEGRVLIDYLHWIIAPTPNALNLYHDDIRLSTGWFSPWTTAASWALITGLIGMALWLKKRVPLFALGVLWFFSGHALVSTYLPLELVYEHRNYLPSWGVFIALFGLVFAWTPVDKERRNIMRTLLFSTVLGLIVLYAGFTELRAQIWGNPYRLAYFQATTHPDSPRASYDLARTMLIMAPNAQSPLFQMGMAQMAKTADLPGASLEAEQALIFMAAKHQLTIPTEWWTKLRIKIENQPLSAESISGIYGLITCGISGICHYPQVAINELGKTLRIAVAKNPKNAAVVTLYANYCANITHDFTQAYQLMQRAVALDPKKYDYWKNLVTLQIAGGQFADAQAGIERMRELNGKGVHDASIAAMQHTLLEKEASSSAKAGAKK